MDHFTQSVPVREASHAASPRALLATPEAILADARFTSLVRERRRFSWLLTTCMLTAYFAFILTIAFRPHLLATPVVAGEPTTWGIVIGFGMFAYTFLLVAIYVARANGVHDNAIAAIVSDRS